LLRVLSSSLPCSFWQGRGAEKASLEPTIQLFLQACRPYSSGSERRLAHVLLSKEPLAEFSAYVPEFGTVISQARAD
jgi:hypothetical protein